MTRVINATVESMQSRVNRMLEVLGRVAKGDYSEQLQVVGKDALAHMAEGMREFFQEKQAVEQRAADIAERDREQAAELRRKVMSCSPSSAPPPKAISPSKSRSG